MDRAQGWRAHFPHHGGFEAVNTVSGYRVQLRIERWDGTDRYVRAGKSVTLAECDSLARARTVVAEVAKVAAVARCENEVVRPCRDLPGQMILPGVGGG